MHLSFCHSNCIFAQLQLNSIRDAFPKSLLALFSQVLLVLKSPDQLSEKMLLCSISKVIKLYSINLLQISFKQQHRVTGTEKDGSNLGNKVCQDTRLLVALPLRGVVVAGKSPLLPETGAATDIHTHPSQKQQGWQQMFPLLFKQWGLVLNIASRMYPLGWVCGCVHQVHCTFRFCHTPSSVKLLVVGLPITIGSGVNITLK